MQPLSPLLFALLISLAVLFLALRLYLRRQQRQFWQEVAHKAGLRYIERGRGGSIELQGERRGEHIVVRVTSGSSAIFVTMISGDRARAWRDPARPTAAPVPDGATARDRSRSRLHDPVTRYRDEHGAFAEATRLPGDPDEAIRWIDDTLLDRDDA